MKSPTRRILSHLAKWGIAAVGIAWVVSNLAVEDRVLVVDDANRPAEYVVSVYEDADGSCRIIDNGQIRDVNPDRVINGPDRKAVTLHSGETFPLRGMKLSREPDHQPVVEALLVERSNGTFEFVEPKQIKGGFESAMPTPRVVLGLRSMLRGADLGLLLAAVAIFGVAHVFTTFRWRALLRGAGILMSWPRAMALNMVGAFYNTFLLGSSGGDVLKAWYAARQVPGRRTSAVMSVVLDRVIGLWVLVMFGGAMAAVTYARGADLSDATAQVCLHVATLAAVILGVTLLGLLLIVSRRTRRMTGYEALARRLPKQAALKKVADVIKTYRQRPALIAGALAMTLPVHLITVTSAMLAGMAFELPIEAAYYFVFVPVVVTLAALPISPQGAGIMEASAFYLTRQYGMTINQVLALTVTIRLIAVAWNLAGGIFVVHLGSSRARHETGDESGVAGTPVLGNLN